MDIRVKSETGKTFLIEKVDPQALNESVKAQILEKLGAFSSDGHLFLCAGKTLEDGRRLCEYIEGGQECVPVAHFVRLCKEGGGHRFFVLVCAVLGEKGSTTTLEVGLDTTVGWVKDAIKTRLKCGAPNDQISLTYGLKECDDSCMLGEYGIQKGDMLEMRRKASPEGGGIPITLRLLTAGRFKENAHIVEVRPGDTVFTLKTLVRAKWAIPPECQQLLVDGKILTEETLPLDQIKTKGGSLPIVYVLFLFPLSGEK
jgi:hypothetical protein